MFLATVPWLDGHEKGSVCLRKAGRQEHIYIYYRTQIRFCFRVVCDNFCLFVNQVSREPLNGVASNLLQRRARANVKVKGQGQQGKTRSALP